MTCISCEQLWNIPLGAKCSHHYHPHMPFLGVAFYPQPSMKAGANLTVFATADWATGAPDLRGETLNEGTEKLESTGGPWSSKVMWRWGLGTYPGKPDTEAGDGKQRLSTSHREEQLSGGRGLVVQRQDYTVPRQGQGQGSHLMPFRVPEAHWTSWTRIPRGAPFAS